MIKIKHFLEPVEKDDGQRLWVEPIGLTRDLQQWCRIDHVLSHLGPPRKLWDWFEKHPDGYEHFRGVYHEHLSRSSYKEALQELARASVRETFTLVHQSELSESNTAVALFEYLSELEAWCPPEGGT